MNRRKILTIYFFLFIQLILSFYVFNYTVRDRTPTLTLHSQEAVICFDISNWGDSLVIGTANGTISYFSTSKTMPQWVYEGGFGVLSIIMSDKGDYVLALDENHTLFLFRALSFGENTPKWTYYLKEGEISGMHSSSGIPTTVYMLATRDGHILLFSNQDDLIWEYSTGTDQVFANISFDGKYVAAVDADGWVYLFDIYDPQPVWSSSTGLRDAVISLSYISQITVGGGDPSGGGRIYSLSIEDGRRIWDWKTSSPVRSISMSSDGVTVTAYENEGQVSILTYISGEIICKQLNIDGDIDSIQSSPFSSYVLAINSEGCVYFFFTPRQTPLWIYDLGTYVVESVMSSIGDKVFISDGNGVVMITNTGESGIIPGSRTLWGVCFITGLIELSFIYYMASENSNWLRSIKTGYPIIISGLFIGTSLGFILQLGILGIFVAGISSAIGSYIGFNKEEFGGFMIGIFTSVAGSLVVSILYGLFLWIGGAEINVVVLIITSVSKGTRFGFIFGLLGTSVGKLIMKFDITN